MVSPRKDQVDVENHTRFGYATNLLGIKSNLLQKPSSVPLGDVRNTLGSAHNIHPLKNISEDVPKNIKKDSELKPPKSIPVPVDIVPEKVEELIDPVWDAPLAYKGVDADSYCDIIPFSLQLTDEDVTRFVLNNPGPRTGISMYNCNDDEDFISCPEIFYDDIYCGFEDMMDSEDDLPEVPAPAFSDSEDCFSDHEF